jgi:hypothetical protein
VYDELNPKETEGGFKVTSHRSEPQTWQAAAAAAARSVKY